MRSRSVYIDRQYAEVVEAVVDCFLFSEAYERELLLAKLHVESELVTHWIAVENAYTTRGEWKGTHLRALIDDDPRFAPFRDRLTIVSLSRAFAKDYRPSLRDRAGKLARRIMSSSTAVRGYEERPYFFAESAQRVAATKSMLDLSNGSGWVIVSDVDELIDASTPSRRARIEDAMSKASIIHLPRRRFVFDFDNVSMAQFRYVPMAKIESLGPSSLGELRLTQVGLPSGLEPLAYEYSYCYQREHITRKLTTFAHNDPGTDALLRALECNHALVGEGQLKNHHWYEMIGAEEAQHPPYISEHLDELKTKNVNPDYRNARSRMYPELFRVRGKSSSPEESPSLGGT